LKAVQDKNQITYKGNSIKTIASFSLVILKAKRAWSEIFQTLKENIFNPGILYPIKQSFKI
jgi:hypothetical protein